MSCGCRGGGGVPSSFTSGAARVANPQIGYIVRMPDGSASEMFDTIDEAYNYAAEFGGSVRSKARPTS